MGVLEGSEEISSEDITRLGLVKNSERIVQIEVHTALNHIDLCPFQVSLQHQLFPEALDELIFVFRSQR